MWGLLWVACRNAAPEGAPIEEAAPLDLTERLPSGVARAGVIDDEAAGFAGVSAEARRGDVKIYNDRVQFVIQGLRDGSYYLSEGGGVIDADIVRPLGVPGRDAIDEWNATFGLGRIMRAERVEVVADGRDGGPAVVRVEGPAVALGLLEGALESPGFVPDLSLRVETVYSLPPDAWLMTATSTVTAESGTATIGMGDLILGAPEVARPFLDGVGHGDEDGGDRRWSAYVSDRNDVAIAVIAPPGERVSARGYELITGLTDLVAAVGPARTVAPDAPLVHTRAFGVAPDLATLTDAALAWHDEPRERREGTVTAPDGPVAGARVTVFQDGAPITVAVTGADGTFGVDVPADGEITWRASGRATGRFLDLPPGAAAYAPYAAEVVRDEALASLRDGAEGPPLADGRGVATAEAPLTLQTPATLAIRAPDGGPFTARLAFANGDPVPFDRGFMHPRAGGLAAAGWATRGALDLLVEPGDYTLIVHRGPRHALHSEPITIGAGERRTVEADLRPAYDTPGWHLGDPHAHASPSSDGQITMEDRLIVTAASGVAVHFGTDHDHLADYRPLIAALGLDARLRSVVADEVSPPLRGHMNVYPVEPTDVANGGAWRWWTEIPDSTEGIVDALRERHGEDFILQLNHPTDNGVVSSASWAPGVIRKPSHWTGRFEAIEVMNAGKVGDYLDVWWDLATRGSRAVPVGVSDSHSHFGGSPGLSATWIHSGTTLDGLTDAVLSDAMRQGHVVISRGPFLELSRLPGDVPAGTTITARALSPSWIHVDRLVLWRDGERAEVVEGAEATFTLSPEADAIYVITAEGDTPMAPLSSWTPWAMTAPWRVDVDGDGFVAPLPPLQIGG